VRRDQASHLDVLTAQITLSHFAPMQIRVSDKNKKGAPVKPERPELRALTSGGCSFV
jgi:hypothetical protein